MGELRSRGIFQPQSGAFQERPHIFRYDPGIRIKNQGETWISKEKTARYQKLRTGNRLCVSLGHNGAFRCSSESPDMSIKQDHDLTCGFWANITDKSVKMSIPLGVR